MPLDADGLQGGLDFRHVLFAVRVIGFQQILNPARVLHHDGQRIVDFVGYSRSQFSNGGQLACFHHLLLHLLLVVFGLEQSLLRASGHGQRGGDDARAAQDHNGQGEQAGLGQGLQEFRFGLVKNQDAARRFERSAGIPLQFTGAIHGLKDNGPSFREDLPGEQAGCFRRARRVFTRSGGSDTVSVQYERSSPSARMKGADFVLDLARIEVCPQQPEFLPRGDAYAQKEVRRPGGQIADKEGTVDGLLEPWLHGSFGMGRGGPGPRDNVAREIDEIEIGEDTLIGILHGVQAFTQVVRAGQVVDGGRSGFLAQVGQFFVEECVNALRVAQDLLAQVDAGFFLVGGVVKDIEKRPEAEQRDDGHQDGHDRQLAAHEPGRGSFFCRHGVFLIRTLWVIRMG